MIIAVASPVHGQSGNTTTAILLSLMLARNGRKRVCLTHLAGKSSSFYDYLGLQALEDTLTAPSQVVKLLREGSITAADLTDYTMHVCDGLDIFGNNSGAVTDEEMGMAQKHIIGHMPHDITIADVDVNTATPIGRHILKTSDILVVTLTQSRNALGRYNEIFEPMHNKTVFVCSHYSPNIGSIQKLGKSLGVSPKQICPISHSDSIMKLSNEGKLASLLDFIQTAPLPSLGTDMKTLSQTILTRYNLGNMRKVGGIK